MRNIAAIKAKTDANYACQECGATELIQTHHQLPGDDSTIVVLCAECHSRKHPNVPKALFLSVIRQSYWFNKSAASLARELGVHPRTIIRAAKRLEILPGDLSPWDEELIKQNIPKLRWEPKSKTVRFPMTCKKCDYSWQALKPDPMCCPHCSTVLNPQLVVKSQRFITCRVEWEGDFEALPEWLKARIKEHKANA